MRLGRADYPEPVQRRSLALALALVALTAASCGGGGSKQLSKSEYETQVGATLRPLQEKTLPEVVVISPAEPKRAVNRLKEVEHALHDASSKLASMKPPGDAAGPTAAIADAIGKIGDEVTAIRKDAEGGNFLKLEQFKLRVASDPAVGQIRDAIVQLVNLGYNIAGAGA
jgi:hypothetical protein